MSDNKRRAKQLQAKAASTIEWTYTRATDSQGHERVAVRVAWDAAEAALGRPHRGTDTDDYVLRAAIMASGAPEWVAKESAEGLLDEGALYLLGTDLAELLDALNRFDNLDMCSSFGIDDEHDDDPDEVVGRGLVRVCDDWANAIVEPVPLLALLRELPADAPIGSATAEAGSIWAAINSSEFQARSPAHDTWINPTHEEQLKLLEQADHVHLGLLVSGSRAVEIGKLASAPGCYGQLVRLFVFHADTADVPRLLGHAEQIGRQDLAEQLRRALGELQDADSVHEHRPLLRSS